MSRLFLVLYSSIGFLLAFAAEITPPGGGCDASCSTRNPGCIPEGFIEARSIPVDLVSATPKRAHAVNFGAGEVFAAVGASG